MSNVINFSVEISPDNKDVALKSMALIAAMAEISMREMANCVEGIEVLDPEEVKSVAAPLKKAEEVEEEKPKRRRKKKSSKTEEEKEESQEEKKEETKKGLGGYGEKPAKEEKAEEKPAKKEEAPAKEESEESDVTIEDVRKALKEVVHNNRDAVVAKLKELGGKNVSTLPEENYGKMYAYLKSLK